MAVATKTRSPDSGTRKAAYFERVLRARAEELRAHLREHRQDVLAERLPDDSWGLASRNQIEDMAVITLEHERRLLNEVEAALARLDESTFGVCEGCGEPIAERRLRALPWTRTCLACAERRQLHLRN